MPDPRSSRPRTPLAPAPCRHDREPGLSGRGEAHVDKGLSVNVDLKVGMLVEVAFETVDDEITLPKSARDVDRVIHL